MKKLVRRTPTGATVVQAVTSEAGHQATPVHVLAALGKLDQNVAATRELVRPTGWGRQSGGSANWRGSR